MKTIFIYFITLPSIVASIALLFQPENKLQTQLTGKDWKQQAIVTIPSGHHLKELASVEEIRVYSTTRYLSNGDYIKSYSLTTFPPENPGTVVKISESGRWELQGNYLLIRQKETQDMPGAYSGILPQALANKFKQAYIQQEQQSKRLDMINRNSILLTNLNGHSQVLYSN